MREHILVGKTISQVLIADDKKALLFKTDAGDIRALCDGDCCSSTWIESVDMPALGFPAKVLEVVDLNLSANNEDGKYGNLTQHYGCKIVTDRGEVVIDYRNESNGYYGGNLHWPDDGYFYGGVHGQNISTEKWVAL